LFHSPIYSLQFQSFNLVSEYSSTMFLSESRAHLPGASSRFIGSQSICVFQWEMGNLTPLHSYTWLQSGFQCLCCCLVTRKTRCVGFFWNYFHWRRRNIRTNWPISFIVIFCWLLLDRTVGGETGNIEKGRGRWAKTRTQISLERQLHLYEDRPENYTDYFLYQFRVKNWKLLDIRVIL